MSKDKPKSEWSAAGWEGFEVIADALKTELDGAWIAQLDGADQRYWDLEVGDAVLTLHLDTYCGISLLASDSSRDPAAASELVSRASSFLDTSSFAE